MMHICIINPSNVTDNWAEYSKFINKTLVYNDGSHNISTILSGILLGTYKLIVCSDGDNINAVSVIEFITYPSKYVLNIAFLCSVDSSKFESEFLNYIFRYGKEHNADSVQMHGRRGWKKVLEKYDFNEIYTVLEREL